MSINHLLKDERKTSSGIFLENMTGLRGWAVMMVLIFHTWGITGGNVKINIPFTDLSVGLTKIIKSGEWGVDIFFVLSGFLLTLPLIKNGIQPIQWEKIKDFYFRRALRILPAFYFASLAAIYILYYHFQQAPTALQALAQITFTNNFFSIPPLRGAFWSLAPEVMFYITLPFLITLAARTKHFLAIFIMMLPAVVAYRFFVINQPIIEAKGAFLFSLPGRIDQFSAGIVCAYMVLKHPPSARTGRNFFAAGAIGLLLFAAFIGRRGDMFFNRDVLYYFTQSIVAILAAFMIYGGASSSKSVKIILGNKIAIFIGLISYSIYLWHTIILDVYARTQTLQNIAIHQKLLVTMASTWPAIMLVSFFSYLFTEQPFLKIRHSSNPPPDLHSGKNPLITLAALAATIIISAGIIQIIKSSH